MQFRMDAEIVMDAARLKPMIAKLERDFELEIIHWPDDEAVTIVATTFTTLSETAFFRQVQSLIKAIDPDAFVMEAGLVLGPSPVRKPGVMKRRFEY
jgi:hypothetical protein